MEGSSDFNQQWAEAQQPYHYAEEAARAEAAQRPEAGPLPPDARFTLVEAPTLTAEEFMAQEDTRRLLARWSTGNHELVLEPAA